MNRRLIVAGLMLLFIAIFGLTGCGLLSQAADADLTNAAGSGDGPGSGKWRPQVPKNNRQARQLFNVLETLSKNGTEEADEYDRIYAFCFDENNKLIPANEGECLPQLNEQARVVERLLVDFDTGSTVWDTWAQEGEEDPPPKTPDPPDPPKKDPPPKKEPGDDDDSGGRTCCWCLTCTYGIEPEFIFQPVEIDVVLNE